MTSRTLAGAALAIALALSACGEAQDPQLRKETLRFTEQQTDNFGFLDNAPRTKIGEEGPESLSNGDQITFSSDLLDAGSKDVGGLDISCAVTRPGGFDTSQQQCTGTATLSDGTLTLARGGRVFGGASATGAILGGSGAYAGASGEFTESEERDGRTPYTFRIWLPED